MEKPRRCHTKTFTHWCKLVQRSAHTRARTHMHTHRKPYKKDALQWDIFSLDNTALKIRLC